MASGVAGQACIAIHRVTTKPRTERRTCDKGRATNIKQQVWSHDRHIGKNGGRSRCPAQAARTKKECPHDCHDRRATPTRWWMGKAAEGTPYVIPPFFTEWRSREIDRECGYQFIFVGGMTKGCAFRNHSDPFMGRGRVASNEGLWKYSSSIRSSLFRTVTHRYGCVRCGTVEVIKVFMSEWDRPFDVQRTDPPWKHEKWNDNMRTIYATWPGGKREGKKHSSVHTGY